MKRTPHGNSSGTSAFKRLLSAAGRLRLFLLGLFLAALPGFALPAFSAVDVQPLSVTRGSSSVVAGGSLAVTWQIRNNGTTAAGTSNSQVRITTSNAATGYGNSSNNAGTSVATGAIAAGATINQNKTVTVPSTAGTYYVWVVADNNSALTQTSTTNDYAVSSSFTVTTPTTVDVQPLSVTRGSSSVVAGGTLAVSWQIRNNGTGSAGTSNSQVRITTSNASSGYGTSSNNVGSAQATGTIAAGTTINQNTNVTVPNTASTFYVWVVADNNSALTQTSTTNDYAVSSSFTVTTPTTVDVQSLSVTRGSSSVVAGGTLAVSWQIRNNGTGSAGTSNSQVRITTSNASSGYGTSSNNVGSAQATGTIAAGATISQNTNVTVPNTAGTYYVWVVADNNSALTQTSTTNDYAVSASFTVTTPTTVDVQPLSVTRGSSSVVAGGTLAVSWQIRNNGTGSAGSSNSQVRITTSNAATGYGTSSNNVGSSQATGTIAAGATIDQNTNVTVPSTAGTYYVWVIADNNSAITQTNVSNDYAVSASFSVTTPTTVDVEPINVTRGSSSVVAGGTLAVSWQVRNNGTASASTSNSQVRITTSNASNGYGSSTNNAGSAQATGTIGAGITINQSTTVTVPSTAGTYYVWVIADNNVPPLLSQSNTSNDFAVSAAFTISAAGTVDVQPLNVTRGSSSVMPGGTLSVSWQIRNNGTLPAGTSNSQVRITNSSSSYGSPSNNVGSAQATGIIAAGATINQITIVTVPGTAGTYYAWVIADNNLPALLAQSDTTNDFAVSASFTVSATGTVDVQPLNVTRSSSSVSPGGTLSVSWQIRNNGTLPASTSNSQVRITNSSSSYGSPSNNVGSTQATGIIVAGATINQSTNVTAPATAGTYYVWVIADNNLPPLLAQSDATNDFAVSASFLVQGQTSSTGEFFF